MYPEILLCVCVESSFCFDEDAARKNPQADFPTEPVPKFVVLNISPSRFSLSYSKTAFPPISDTFKKEPELVTLIHT